MITILKVIAKLAIDLVMDIIIDGLFNIIGCAATVIAVTSFKPKLMEVEIPEWIKNKR